VVLTGRPAEPVLDGGRVWRRRPAGQPIRVTALKDDYRPSRLWPAHRDGRPQLATANWKSTRFMPFDHNCLFLFAWADPVTPTWLGSALSRPYTEACHADLRGDGLWRLIAIETDAAGQPSLGVYRPVGFGYEGDWRSEPVRWAARVRAFGNAVVVSGAETAEMLPSDDGYRLVRLDGEPLELDGVVRAGNSLIGHGERGWRRTPLTAVEGNNHG